MCAWDKTQPLGSDLANTIDNEMREMKTDIEAALQGQATEGDEAIFPGSDSANPAFRYRGLKGGTGSRPASGQYGLYFDTTRNAMQRDNGSSWDDVGTMIPSGTKMIFFQASVPTGWTIDTTHNDKALRVVSGTGGGNGGTHALSSPPTAAHTHTVTSGSAGSHTHTVSTVPNSVNSGSSGNDAARNTHVHSLTTDGSHSHSNSADSGGPTAFAPQYIDVLVGTKD